MVFDKTLIVVAETGAMHEGSPGTLDQLIRQTHIAGADAVKFQIRVCAAEVSEDEQFRPGTQGINDETRAEYWERIELTPEQWKTAAETAKALGLIVGASVFSPEGVQVAVDAGVDYLKIGSGHSDDKEIVTPALETEKLVVISYGFGRNHFYRSAALDRCCFVSMQAQSIYPTPHGLCKRFDDEDFWSYSCHTGTIEPVIDALSRGAQMVEVHVCFNKKNDLPDTSSSITFKQLRAICRHRDFIREASNWTPEKEAECKRLTEETRRAIQTGKRFIDQFTR